MSVMGSRAAYKEACRRWGGDATVALCDGACHVGVRKWLRIFAVKGRGKTWALAFTDADRRAGRKQETTP